jgi:hypothetical protein
LRLVRAVVSATLCTLSLGASETAFYEVELRPQGAIVRRTTRRYVELAEIAPSFAAINKQIAALTRAADTVLVDLRAAVGRNDPAFEATIAPLRRTLLRKFERVGVLVRSGIGRLQLQRYLAEDGITATVFADEAAAMRWFAGAS